jgi:hypothetical protein
MQPRSHQQHSSPLNCIREASTRFSFLYCAKEDAWSPPRAAIVHFVLNEGNDKLHAAQAL